MFVAGMQLYSDTKLFNTMSANSLNTLLETKARSIISSSISVDHDQFA
jgi:hypothetical protein|tara:strand:- start:698 stop:841 length:144 start_codon:yes stop_codon:yes gene_type:complete